METPVKGRVVWNRPLRGHLIKFYTCQSKQKICGTKKMKAIKMIKNSMVQTLKVPKDFSGINKKIRIKTFFVKQHSGRFKSNNVEDLGLKHDSKGNLKFRRHKKLQSEKNQWKPRNKLEKSKNVYFNRKILQTEYPNWKLNKIMKTRQTWTFFTVPQCRGGPFRKFRHETEPPPLSSQIDVISTQKYTQQQKKQEQHWPRRHRDRIGSRSAGRRIDQNHQTRGSAEITSSRTINRSVLESIYL